MLGLLLQSFSSSSSSSSSVSSSDEKGLTGPEDPAAIPIPPRAVSASDDASPCTREIDDEDEDEDDDDDDSDREPTLPDTRGHAHDEECGGPKGAETWKRGVV